MIKNRNMRIIKIFIVFMILMTTFISYKSHANIIEDSHLEVEPMTEGKKYSYEDLKSLWYLLCSEHGQHMPGATSTRFALPGDMKYSVDNIIKYGKDTEQFGENAATYEILKGTYYMTDEVAYYAEKQTITCTPKSAYILNFANENTDSYPGKIQCAWWTTSENISNQTEGDNALSLTASAYQDFVKKIAKYPNDVEKSSANEPLKHYETLTHTYEDGTTATIEFPERKEIKDTFLFNTSDMTVNFNEGTQKYLIGPFTLTYVDDSYNGVDFGLIDKFDIYTDASTEALTEDQWRFVYPKAHDETKKYPASKEKFYIEMDYIPNATKITGIDIDYKYLIAGGKYQQLTGTYDKFKWTCTRTASAWDEDGHVISYNYNLQAKRQKLALDSQALALTNTAARWYEIEKISIKQNEATLKIEKAAIDETGLELTAEQVKDLFGEYQYFDFEVKITHSDGTVENVITTVMAGTTETVGTYTWSDTESAPTYEIKEVSLSTDGSWKAVAIDSASGTLENGKTVTAFGVNQLINKKHDKIEITKTIDGIADADEVFQFQVVVTMPSGKQDTQIATIVVPKGQLTGNVWTSKEYVWYGDKTPTYEIIELETEASKKYNPVINPSQGYLDGSGATVKVNAVNYAKEDYKKGYLTIQKDLQNGQMTDDIYEFHVRVDGIKNTPSGTAEFMVRVKAGQKAGPYQFIWDRNASNPRFTITEMTNNEIQNVNIEVTGADNVSKAGAQVTGTLREGNAYVNAKFTNDVSRHSGNIKVVKNFFSTEKMTSDELKAVASELNVRFNVEVTIRGTFIYNGMYVRNSTRVITKTLSKDNNWEFSIDNIIWYGPNAPTYSVREVSLPNKWKCRSIHYSDVENTSVYTPSHNLVDNQTVVATIVNEIPSDTSIDLTFKMAGIVWVDDTLDEKNDIHGDGYYKAPNGVYDEGETLKENAEVTVYKVVRDPAGNVITRDVATAYKDAQNNPIVFPIITKTDGKWDVPRIQVPGLAKELIALGYTASYDVEFAYDGQTYEPTEFLSYKVSSSQKDGYNQEYDKYYAKKNEGTVAQKAAEYRNATKAGKKEYEKDSMAIETSNNAANIVEVSGKTPINSNGDTTGIATLSNGAKVEVTYSSANAGTGYPTQSTLNTTNKDGRVLDIFKATATTSAGNLTFPFKVDAYDGSSLTDINKRVDDAGFHTTYKFMAVYNYCLHINLGLKAKEDVDVALTKNLDNAKVVVNEKMYQYNYSGYYDLTEQKLSSLSKDIYVGNNEEKIEYTLGIYKSDYYYRAEMYINGQDKSLYDRLENFYATLNGKKTLKDTELDIYLTYKIKLQNSSSGYDVQINSLDDYYDNSLTLITANETKYLRTQTIGGKESDVNEQVVVANASDYSDKWLTTRKGIIGSDVDANGKNVVYNKMTANGLGIVLGPGESKELMVTFKVNKGKDSEYGIEDSIKLGQKCNVAEIASYSTFKQGTRINAGRIDRDSAPGNVNIAVYNDKSWYEDDTFAAPRIKLNLVNSNVDRTINGVAWEDNSKDKNTENPGYNQQVGNGIKESDEKTIEGLTTELVEKVAIKNQDGTYTEYDYIWPTAQKLNCLNGKTIEEVTGLDTTITTDKNGEYTFQNVIAGDYIVRFTYGEKKIESADYSQAKYYNGQDYKATRFKGDLKTGTELKADSYLDIEKVNAYTERKNTANDNEVRRLQVVAKSREITYTNSSIMADYEGNKLYEDYYMFAETPKLDVNIELADFGKENYTYTVKNVDFGLEERPITQLTLDKQIEEIILTTSDGIDIMDAKYKIAYAVKDDGSITANVELDTANSFGIDNLQSLNRDQATTHGFRYISVDSKILEGITITVKYKFTVLNTGEVDRTGELANMVYNDDVTALAKASDELSKQFAMYRKDGNSLKNDTMLGKYVGSIYYYGANGNQNDAIVTSTVRQLVDYIDNNVVFSGMLNASANTSWRNVTTEELKEKIDPSILNENGMIVDSHGVQYETGNRNNLVVSVESEDANNTINNKDFIIELQPEFATRTTAKNYQAAMYLTTTKYIGSDSDDLQIDNIAEIIKYNNKVGRRDELSIAGNQNPATALTKNVGIDTDTTLSSGMQYERDTSATEVITLSPPFGSGLMIWKLQIVASVAIGLIIVAGGIVVIKKKILK